MSSSLRGAAAVVGIGQTPYYKRSTSPDPEVKLAMRAVDSACNDASISTKEIDGFVSYGSERSDGQKLVRGLGCREMTFGALMWTHGGGIPGALGLASTAIATGQAKTVAVYRSMAEQNGLRLRVAVAQDDTAAQYIVNGIGAPAQQCAMRSQRMIEGDGVPASALRAMVLASYRHAQNSPIALGRGNHLDEESYAEARWISEPYRLFDCSRECDAGMAVIMVAADRAKDLVDRPAYLLSAPMGYTNGWGGAMEENHNPYTSSGFESVARRLWAESGYGPSDIDVTQVYENMSGMGVASIIDHGFCTTEEAGDFFTVENLTAPDGKFPINTSGGNLAEGFLHGMGLVPEMVRQIRGTSPNQVPDAHLSLMTGGPGDMMVSSALLGSVDTL